MSSRKVREGREKAYGRSRGGPGCLSMLFLVLLVLAAVTATIAIFFRISRIEIRGNERYSTEEIRVASGVEQGDNLLLFNKFKAISGIFSKLPYVDEIRMSRDLPDTLVIEVAETSARAYIAVPSGYWLLSPKGKLLERRLTLPDDDLIEIRGAALVAPEPGKTADFGPEEKMRFAAMTDTLSTLESMGVAKDVDSIDISKVYNIEIGYLNRFCVKLGMPENLDYKIEFLKEKVVTKLNPNDTGVIDLSELIEKKQARFIPD